MAIDITAISNEEKAAIVCLYFSRLASTDPRYKRKWTPTLTLLSSSYNVKYATLRNNKNRFEAQFPNGRKGWYQTPLEKQNKFLYEEYLKYKDMPLDEMQALVDEIIAEAKQEGKPFYSIKTKNPVQVEAILSKGSNIEIDGLNVLKEHLTLGQLVFIVLGGDKPAWETGLIGIGEISQPPYDEGYEKKNYRIKIDVKVLLDKPIKRDNLVPYKDTYDIIGIGPNTKWEPNQAISSISEKKAVALMRAMLDLCPGIEADLSGIVSKVLLSRIKGSAVMMVSAEVDYGEQPPIMDASSDPEEAEDEYESDDFADIYEPDIDAILKGFSMSANPILLMKNSINAGKHIIMTGPPGTGKTTLAERACDEALRLNYISGYTLTTAIADWSTFDTIGGYMPDKDGCLAFQEGIFLKSICENKWLIVDEINRAEIDKAFGHFFTVLSGKDVELQYKAETSSGDKNISLRHSNTKHSFYDPESATYFIGRNWRIIATMNTYDKNSLFMLSYAFMRRFSFAYIPAPSEAAFAELICNRLPDRPDIAEILTKIAKASPKKMGAAIILDLANYLETAGYEGIADGICSLIIPQFEGLSLPQIKLLYRDFGSLLDEADKESFKQYLCEFFDISPAELNKVKFADNGESEEEADESDD